MAAKDLTEKILEDYNDVFADIINVLLFEGEQRVLPESLKNTSVHSMYKSSDSSLHELERDIAKIWTKGDIEIALCGIENQTKIEKLMPLRIAGYEGASYRSQYNKAYATPVVTLVLYFGNDHWNQPKSIKELLSIPDGLEKYVNDTKIHVFEIAWLTDEQISRFTSDFKIVANFFVEKRKNKDYIPNDTTEITHVDEVLKLLSVMTGDHRYESILVGSEKGRVTTMCDVAERLEMKGLAKGKAEGLAEGLAKGLAEKSLQVYNNCLARGISKDDALSLIGMSEEELVKIQASN